MSHYVYSTLSSPVSYATYKTDTKDIPVIEKNILIKGGTGVSDKNFVTPKGVVTEVTSEELEHLKSNEVFKLHMQNGFITVEEKKQKPVEKVVVNMKDADKSSPIRPQDFVTDKDGNRRLERGGI